jgi:hypothetical protein
MGYTNFAERAYGLDTEMKRRVNEMLHDYDPKLSLRRIPADDPWFDPQKPYGVWEDGVNTAAVANWVTSVPESEIDHRLVAIIIEGDMKRVGVPERQARLKAFAASQQLARAKEQAEIDEQRADVIRTVAALAKGKHGIRLDVNGELMIFSDDPAGRRARTVVR